MSLHVQSLQDYKETLKENGFYVIALKMCEE